MHSMSTKWTAFSESYESATDDNGHHTVIDKLNLENSTAKPTDGRQLTNAHYDEAIKIV